MERWSPETKRYVLTLALVGLFALVYMARSVLPLVLWAGLFAFVLNPVVTALHRLHVPRMLAVLLVYLLFLTLLITGPLIIIPLVIQQVVTMWAGLHPQELGVRLYQWALRMTQEYQQGQIFGFSYDLAPYMATWMDWLQSGAWTNMVPSASDILAATERAISAATGLVLGATGVAGTVAWRITTGILAFFLTLIYTLYLLVIAPRLRVAIYELFPEGYQHEVEYLIDRIAATWRRYLRGQIFLSLVIFLLSWVGLSIIGMPSAFLLALIAGVLEIVPNLGPILATVPAVLVALIQGSLHWDIPHWQFALITLGLYTLIQQLENNLLVPRIVGNVVNVHPFLVLIAIIVGTDVGGVLGALLAAPTLATLRILTEYIHARLLDRPPFPELALRAEPPSVIPVPPPEAIARMPAPVQPAAPRPTVANAPAPNPQTREPAPQEEDGEGEEVMRSQAHQTTRNSENSPV